MFQGAITKNAVNYQSIIQNAEGAVPQAQAPEAAVEKKNPYAANEQKIIGHRPRQGENTHATSDLITKFDPVTDRHLWAMWRTAVNGRLVEKVMTNETTRYDEYVRGGSMFSDSGGGGDDSNSVPSLGRFIRLNEKSEQHLRTMRQTDREGQLNLTQYVFYGLPRVNISTKGQGAQNHKHTNSNGMTSFVQYQNGPHPPNPNGFISNGMTGGQQVQRMPPGRPPMPRLDPNNRRLH